MLEELDLGQADGGHEEQRRRRIGIGRDAKLSARATWRSSARPSRSAAITVVDVIKALARRGFAEEAENLLKLVKLRVSGDYLQTSAMVRDGRVLSAVNDPNDYLGPGTGYRVSEARREEIVAIRDVLDPRGGAASRGRAQGRREQARQLPDDGPGRRRATIAARS